MCIRSDISAVILIYISFCNYIDRYLLAGVLIDIQDEFRITNDYAGLIQVIFLFVYTVSGPIFGMMSTPSNRKYLLVFAVLLWNSANLISSFITEYWMFCLLRAILGLGTACYSHLTRSILSNLVLDKDRDILVVLYYISVPVGTGLSYIVSTQMTLKFGNWRWSLRATPFLAIPNAFLLLLGFVEPRSQPLEEGTETESCFKQLKYFFTNRSYILSSVGFAFAVFATGILNWWTPKLNYLGFSIRNDNINRYTEGTIYGFVCILSGVTGLALGYLATFKLKHQWPRVKPTVCAIGSFVSAFFLAGAVIASDDDRLICYVLYSIAYAFLHVTWSLYHISLRVVVPSKRSSAVGVRILLGHALGDMDSPLTVGSVSEFLMHEWGLSQFEALRYGYYLGSLVQIVGSVCFLLTAVFYPEDLDKVSKYLEEHPNERSSVRLSNSEM